MANFNEVYEYCSDLVAELKNKKYHLDYVTPDISQRDPDELRVRIHLYAFNLDSGEFEKASIALYWLDIKKFVEGKADTLEGTMSGNPNLRPEPLKVTN